MLKIQINKLKRALWRTFFDLASLEKIRTGALLLNVLYFTNPNVAEANILAMLLEFEASKR